jgi:RimJ/RimL family protein N-acetyltransferase
MTKAWCQLRMHTISAIDRLSTNRIVLEPLRDGDQQLPFSAVDERSLRRVLPARGALPALANGHLSAGIEQTGEAARIDFAVIALETGAVIGLAQLLDINPGQRRVTLGPCWTSAQGRDSAIVRHATYLLLQLGFETLGCLRLDVRADARDRAARKTLQWLGFSCEGVLRSFEARPDGKAADIAVWSVILPEWQRVKARLQAALANEDWPWKDRLPSILPP